MLYGTCPFDTDTDTDPDPDLASPWTFSEDLKQTSRPPAPSAGVLPIRIQ
ncbi:MAG: hypothetical protein ACOX52_15315 [Verrucomicrobiota bacterium]